jgi:hypothetical protein
MAVCLDERATWLVMESDFLGDAGWMVSDVPSAKLSDYPLMGRNWLSPALMSVCFDERAI